MANQQLLTCPRCRMTGGVRDDGYHGLCFMQEQLSEAQAEIVRLRDLAQGRLEHFQASEESRRLHFQRAHDAREVLREIVYAYGLGGSPEAFCRWIEEPIKTAQKLLSE